ncbi:P27 family phage terminase small subunit [Metaclostridioides mangenotii]|uniref:Uncharacterized protein n=1 Tax=Metaclostridioides mangenotii TaxID=1540 RepID=A0ABS4E6Z9_9FIRM|nr:P27 family phage terminase small subunit [Clostridioides mangenotii]MBP1853710.1 hypothetical protein [Clostridioides mangenotii]
MAAKKENEITETRERIENALIEQLDERGQYKEPFADLVQRYMKMWDTTIALEQNVEEYGVMFDSERGVKKNDAVNQLMQMNKQMLILLDKLNITTDKVKADDGCDI